MEDSRGNYQSNGYLRDVDDGYHHDRSSNIVYFLYHMFLMKFCKLFVYCQTYTDIKI